MNARFVVFLCLCLLCLAIRDGYELLKERGRIDPHSTPVFVVVFACMAAMLTSWTLFCPADPWRLLVPEAARWAGRGALAFGLGLALATFVQLRALENVDHLVTSGLFRKLRHPMYTGFMLWILGWVVSSGSPAGAIAAVPAFASILFWRHLEEKRLVAAYGDAYRDYRARSWL